MLRMRLGNCCTNHGDSRRIYPARQTKSTWCSSRASATARSCSSRAPAFDGITNALSPRRRADSIPGASALLEMTTAMFASSLPDATLAAMASKFDPRPERSMPRFFIDDAEMIPVPRRDCRCFRQAVNRIDQMSDDRLSASEAALREWRLPAQEFFDAWPVQENARSRRQVLAIVRSK